MTTDDSRCELCNQIRTLTRHHLIPKSLHNRDKIHTKEELAKCLQLCKLCHDGIHDLFSEKDLFREYHTKEKLLENEAIVRHIAWSRKQKVI